MSTYEDLLLYTSILTFSNSHMFDIYAQLRALALESKVTSPAAHQEKVGTNYLFHYYSSLLFLVSLYTFLLGATITISTPSLSLSSLTNLLICICKLLYLQFC